MNVIEDLRIKLRNMGYSAPAVHHILRWYSKNDLSSTLSKGLSHNSEDAKEPLKESLNQEEQQDGTQCPPRSN